MFKIKNIVLFLDFCIRFGYKVIFVKTLDFLGPGHVFQTFNTKKPLRVTLINCSGNVFQKNNNQICLS